MLDNEVDNVLIGNNYLSGLYSFNLMKNKKQVLLLDDKSTRYGELYTNFLGQLEKDFLQTWLQYIEDFSSLDIDRYISKKKIILSIDNNRIRLGETPWQNYREMLRKLPFCFKKEGKLFLTPIESKKNSDRFDRNYFAYCHRLARSIWMTEIEKLTPEVFFENCPEELMTIFQLFQSSLQLKKHMKKEERENLNTFVYMTRGYFHKKLTVHADSLELFHLILSLISPRYELDENTFLSDIRKNYINRGGLFRKTSVKQWYFDRCRPWRLELNSYEGVICPKYISFFGGHPSGIPIDFGPHVDNYTCVDVSLKLKENHLTHWKNEKILCSRSEDIGTNYPLWTADFSPGIIKAKVFIENHFGNKIDFVQKKIHRFLMDRLSPFVTDLEDIIEDEKMQFNPEILIKTKGRQAFSNRRIIISDISNPMKRIILKDVDYFGPFKGGNFGILSTLMELTKDDSSSYQK